MSRTLSRGPVIVLILIGACADADESEATGEVVVSFEAETVSCGIGGNRILGRVGQPLRLRARSELVTSKCQCQHRSASQYGCGTQCTSDYDLGARNVGMCTPESVRPFAMGEVRVASESGCTARTEVSRDDPSVADVTVECAVEAQVLVRGDVPGPSGRYVTFTSDGACPRPPPKPVDGGDAAGPEDPDGATDGATGATDGGDAD